MTKYQAYVLRKQTILVEFETEDKSPKDVAINLVADHAKHLQMEGAKVTYMADLSYEVTDLKVITKCYRVLIEKTFHYTVEVDAENADEAEKEATDQLEASHAPNEYLDDEGDYEATDVTVID